MFIPRFQSICRMMCVCAAASVIAAAAPAQEKDMAWSYDTVVEPLDRPRWLDKVVLIDSFCDFPFGPAGELVPWARELQKAGFTILTYHQLEKIPEAHALGVKIAYGMRPFIAEGWKEEAIKSHPEWLLQREPGVPYDENSACLISPFCDVLVDVLAQNIKRYGIDAYTFDGWYQCQYCCCEYCRTTYKQETGFDVPPGMDGSDVNYRRYLAWRNKKLVERALQLRKAVKAANPEAILVNWSNNDANGAYPSLMPESLNCVFDMTWKEWWDAFDVYSIWLNKRLRGSGGDRAPGMQPYTFIRWMKDIKSGVYHGSSTPMAEVLYRMHEAMAMGAVPIIWSGARTGWQPGDWDKVIKDTVDFLPYVNNTRTLKYAACIDSYTTLQMSGIPTEGEFHGPMQKMLNEKVAFHRGGVARALLESHIPFDVISEHNVTAQILAQYRVVVLPNNACMSDRIAKVLRDYVAGGGGLVATFETSLYDHLGEKRADFALADVFGAAYKASHEVSPHRMNFSSTAHPITDDPYLVNLMGKNGYNTFWGKFTRVAPGPGTISPMVCLDVPNEKDETLKNWPPLLVSEYNKGRSAYFPAAIDCAYYDASYPYQRVLIANAVRWAAREEPRVRVKAPLCVFAGFFTKKEGSHNQTIVHLLNTLNTTTGHGSPEDKEFALREEVIPIHDVEVTFAGAKPRRVRLVPDGIDLQPARSEEGWAVVVPKMGLHSAVVAEY